MNLTYEPLTPRQIEDVHQATLDVLWQCGAEMNHPKILETFKKHGATVEGNVVKIPANLIENAIKTAPGSYLLEAVDPKYCVQVGHNDHPIMAPNTCSPFIIDDDNQRRNASFDDLRNFLKLSQTSDVCELGSTLLVFPVENTTHYESIMRPVYEYFTHCTKAMGLSNACVDNVRMAQETLDILIEKENAYKMYVSLCPISPLRFEESLLDTILQAIEFKQPVQCVPCSSAGMTGPIKAIDNTILSNAENVALMTLVQLLSPGLPSMYSVYSAITDTRMLQLSTGAPETFKMLAMARQMARYYDVPFEMPSAGTDAKSFDVQAPMESTLGIINAFATQTDTCTFMFGSMDTFNSANYRKFI
ncbi:MAG: trimethylamine methyltransferase family protein, partial [Eubacterium sp.]